MLKNLKFLKIFKERDTGFKPYYEKENDFARLSVIHSIAAFIIAPIFCLLIYNSEFSKIYFYIGLSYTVLFPIYIMLCWMIKSLNNKLIYFFIVHLFGITYLAFIDLVQNNFELLDLYSFYALYSIVIFVMQRLYPIIIYNIFVLALLLYGFQFVDQIDISKAGIFGLFATLAFCSTLVLFSRKRMINSVEDYSKYLKKIVTNPWMGHALFELKNDVIILRDKSTTFKTLIAEPNKEINETFYEIIKGSSFDKIKNLVPDQNVSINIEKNTDQGKRHLEIMFTLLILKNNAFHLARVTDVTERYKEKEDLILSEEKYRNLYHRNQAGVFTVDKESRIIDFNSSFYSIFDENFSKGDLFFEGQNKDTWEDLYKLIKSDNILRNYQTHFNFGNGVVKWFVFNWFLDTKTNFIEGTVVDITEVQLATTALKQSEQKYRLIYEESNDAILLLNKDKIIDVNRKGIQLFGISEADLLDENLFDLSLDLSLESEKEYNKIKQKLHLSRSIKFNWVFKGNAQKIEAEVAIVELIIADQVYYQCVINDVTERNETIRALDRNKKSYESILENTPEGILIIKAGEILYSNKEVINLYETDKIVYNNLFRGEDQKTFEELYKKHQETKEKTIGQLHIARNSNDISTSVTLVSTDYFDEEATLVIIKDISFESQLSKEVLRAELAEETNKHLEKEIKERIKAEKKFENLFLKSRAIFDSSANTLLITVDRNFKIATFNSRCAYYFDNLTNLKMEEGFDFLVYFGHLYSADEVELFKSILDEVAQGESKQIESKYTNKGKNYWLDIFINPIFNSDGKVSEISMVAHDITEKKKTQFEVIESLKEKEVLLKEIHHRVKNNLQVISSILNLQSSFVHDEKTLDLLQESRNRIRSMAIIHENLYRTTNFSFIDFSSYISNLATNLVASYRLSDEQVKIEYKMDAVDLVLDQAIPCGLIVNELITNAIKYAFPNHKKGNIFITLREVNNVISLTIKDDGIGLPENFDIENTDTLGLQLVITLIEQLDGTMTQNNTSGTEFLINFEKTKV